MLVIGAINPVLWTVPEIGHFNSCSGVFLVITSSFTLVDHRNTFNVPKLTTSDCAAIIELLPVCFSRFRGHCVYLA